MSVAVRLLAFAALALVVFGGAALAGAATGPDAPGSPAGGAHGGSAAQGGDAAAHGGSSGEAAHGGGHAGAGRAAGADLGGLAVSSGGYALELDQPYRTAGSAAPVRFRIVDRRGEVVRDGFEIEHEKELHLIVVRRDTAVFRHVHPTRAADGTWSASLPLADAGVYRVYADFVVGGEKHVLGADLFVPGRFVPQPLPAPRASAPATDEDGGSAGLDVALTAPGLRAGRETRLSFAVTRGGRPVAALQPYLGARGHLVALREGDLGYLHVHPLQAAGHDHGDSPSSAPHDGEVAFAATFPTPGRYRLFLQVRTDGVVRTVAHTIAVPR